MPNNGKMTKEVKGRVLSLMNLALEYNSHETTQELTGNKPTFFVWFNGHTCDLDVAVYTGGYSANSKCIQESISLTSSFSSNTDEKILAALDRWIDLFISLQYEWRRAQKDNLDELLVDEYKGTELEGMFLDEQ